MIRLRIMTNNGDFTCRFRLKDISLYADGMLKNPDSLRKHIRKCPHCAKVLKAMAATNDDLRHMPQITPDGAFHADAMAALTGGPDNIRKDSDQAGNRFVISFCGAVASMALFVIAGSALAGGFSELYNNTSDTLIGEANYTGQTENTVGGGAYVDYDADIASTRAVPEAFAQSTEMIDITGTTEMTLAYSPDGYAQDGGFLTRTAPIQTEPTLIDMAEPASAPMPKSQGIYNLEEEAALTGQEPFAIAQGDSITTDEAVIFNNDWAVPPDLTGGYMAEYCDITIETDDAEYVLNRVAGMGADVKSSGIYSAGGGAVRAEMTVSVPAGRLTYYIIEMSNLGEVTARNEYVYSLDTDIKDAENNLTVSRGEFERLSSYSGRTGNLEDLIMLNDRVSRVISDMDQWQGRLGSLYNEAENAVMSITVTENESTVPLSFSQRIRTGFSDSITALSTTAENIVVWTAEVSVWLGLGLVLGAAVYMVHVLVKRRRSGHDFER